MRSEQLTCLEDVCASCAESGFKSGFKETAEELLVNDVRLYVHVCHHNLHSHTLGLNIKQCVSFEGQKETYMYCFISIFIPKRHLSGNDLS